MARPKKQIDYEEVRRLQALGWGARRIARRVGGSRSLIQRKLATTRPRKPGLSMGASASAGWGATQRAGPRSRRPDGDRRHAHELLAIRRGGTTDEEFAAAETRLDELLDSMPDSSAYSVAMDVQDELQARVRKREDAARRARDERERWEEDAETDLGARWEFEVKLVTRGIDDLDYSERSEIEEVLDEEKKRAKTLLVRRMKEMQTGTLIEGLIDRLVEQGLQRVDHLLKKLR